MPMKQSNIFMANYKRVTVEIDRLLNDAAHLTVHSFATILFLN